MLKDVLTQKGLSSREAEVAELVSKGLSNKEVASQLFVTEKTVKFHLTNIYKKMAVKSRAQLIVWCVPHVDFVPSTSAANTTTAQSAIGTTGNIGGNTNQGSALSAPAASGLSYNASGTNNNSGNNNI